MIRGVIAIVGLTVLMLCLIHVYAEAQPHNFYLYIYGSYGCPHCRKMKELFTEWYGSQHVYFCSVDNPSGSCARRFYAICEALRLPLAVPLIFVIVDDGIRAVVLGEVRNKTFWDTLLQREASNVIPIYMGEEKVGRITVKDLYAFTKVVAPEVFSLNVAVHKTTLQNISTVSTSSKKRGLHGVTLLQPGENVFLALVSLALSDSVNPCTIYIYTLLLIAAALASYTEGSVHKKRRLSKQVIVCGFAFILAVYIGYMSLGLGLTYVFRYVSENRWIFAFVAIAFGLWTVVSGILKRSRIIAKGLVLDLLSRASTSSIFSFVLGLLLTFTLLPCSAGPYVVFTGLISAYPMYIAVPLLALYNLLFVTPLIAILILISFGMSIHKVQQFIIEKSSLLSIIAGTIMVLIGVAVFLGMM